MISCQFSHTISAHAEMGADVYLVGVTEGNRTPFVERFRAPEDAEVISMTNVDEGVIHVFFNNRTVYEFGRYVDPHGPIFRLIGLLP